MKKIFLAPLGLVLGMSLTMAVHAQEAVKSEAGDAPHAPVTQAVEDQPSCADLISVESVEAAETAKAGIKADEKESAKMGEKTSEKLGEKLVEKTGEKTGADGEKATLPVVPAKKKLDPATEEAMTGKTLFNAHCAGCHGPDGANPVGKWQAGIMGMEASATLGAMDSIKATPNATGGRLIMQNQFKRMKPDALKALADYISTL